MLGRLGVGDYAIVVTDWAAGRIGWQSPDRGLRKADWGRESSEVSKATVQPPRGRPRNQCAAALRHAPRP